ncbi:MAG: hypothetical protein NDJ92_15895 [Thermoanaerobaculia bacterium]|nr:hypothetical protein [Thermoanaerobaculia bacterium]
MRQPWFALVPLIVAGTLNADPTVPLAAQSRPVAGNLSRAASEMKRPVEQLVAIIDADTGDVEEVKLAIAELRTGTKESLASAAGRISRVRGRAVRERLSSASSLDEAHLVFKDAVAAYPSIDEGRLREAAHHLALHPVREVLRQHLAAADLLRESLAASMSELERSSGALEEAMTRGLLEKKSGVAR